MKNPLLLLIVFLFTFIGCTLEDRTENLNIKLYTGETYRFNENTLAVSYATNDFIAKLYGNEVTGVHIGRTTMTVIGEHTTYNCIIDVEARDKIYVDMSVYLGKSMQDIVMQFGQPILRNGDLYLFGKLGGLTILPEIQNAFVIIKDRVISCAIYFDIKDKEIVKNHIYDRYESYLTENYAITFGDAYLYENSNVLVQYTFGDNPIFVAYTTRAYVESLNLWKSSSYSLIDQYKIKPNL